MTASPATAEPLSLLQTAEQSAAWPFEEARKLVARVQRTGQKEVLFETGYGPSGLPHIGTFGEVARTTMVRHAFRVLTRGPHPDAAGRLLRRHGRPAQGARQRAQPGAAGAPSRQAADRRCPIRSARMRASASTTTRGCAPSSTRFGFDYEFLSSTECYKSGRFDATLLLMLERYDAVMAIMLPTLREERRADLFAVPADPSRDRRRPAGADRRVRRARPARSSGAIPATGERFETPVTGGHCKLQWKPDWAMRWVALGVDYEMAGKDLIDSVKLSGEIARALGGQPPEGFNYELFLDEKGEKISKSKGNGLTIEEWLAYGTPGEPVALHVPASRARRSGCISTSSRAQVDDYLTFLEKYPRPGRCKEQLGNPVWHIHARQAAGARARARRRRATARRRRSPSRCCSTSWRSRIPRIRRCCGASSAATRRASRRQTHPRLDQLVGYAVAYFRDFVRAGEGLPPRRTRPSGAALADLSAALAPLRGLDRRRSAAGRRLRGRPPALPRSPAASRRARTGGPASRSAGSRRSTEILLGQERGPRFGSFVALYGVAETRALIAKALSGRAHRRARGLPRRRARPD